MTRWHDLQPADDAFFDATRARVYRFSKRLPVPGPSVWAALTSDASIATWKMPPGFAIRSRWTSPRPFDVGTTREVTLPTGFALRERFFRWNAAGRHSFYAEAANRPGLRCFAEDYLVAPAGDEDCTLNWTIALEPSWPAARIVTPAIALNRLAFAQTFAAAVRTLERMTGRSR